ncbi:hypothetical protein GGX14DRAFT_539451 [Mycena pura]|uniref:Homeobox domain-containing protein n=1 Tax=Mycena pura TaxID=153505 RepID=A0AAD6YP44_9AGAR|nr:hypothetical protein GGX14DRAFT_539451 [Mycena pura]
MADIESLRAIIRTGRSLQGHSLQDKSPGSAPLNHLPLAPISLPDPPSIHTQLIRLGCSSRLADDASRIYALNSERIRVATQTFFQRAFSELAKQPRHSAQTPFPRLLEDFATTWYIRSLETLQQKALAAVKRRLAARRQNEVKASEEKKPFNHEFTPFLQQYFEYNAYPSAADRLEMANKSMMDPRQIEVWFQNHRRRAKKEGVDIRRLRPGDPAPLELCLKLMEEQMETYLVPEALRQFPDSDISEVGSEYEEDDDECDFYDEPEEVDLSRALDPPASRHAFPTTFVESRSMPSIIVPTQHFSFPPPDWPRKASVAPMPKRPIVTVDECVAAFAAMNVRDSRSVVSPPFQIAYTVIPPPAPLAALVPGKVTLAAVRPTTALNIVPARRSRSRQHPFRSPSPASRLASLVPAATATTPRRRKKPAGIPHRSPRRANPRGASPATSESSASSPPSRTPSLESSSRTPSFGSSRSSSSSSGPTTPVGSSSPLPLLEIADPAYFDVFGDPAPAYGQYVKTPQFAFAAYQTH